MFSPSECFCPNHHCFALKFSNISSATGGLQHPPPWSVFLCYWLILISLILKLVTYFEWNAPYELPNHSRNFFLLCFMLLQIKCFIVSSNVFHNQLLSLKINNSQYQTRWFGEWVSVFIHWWNQSIIVNGLLLITIDYIDCNQWLIFIDWCCQANFIVNGHK